MMELCPLCNKMTAERSHYTGVLICYNRDCMGQYIEDHKTVDLQLKELRARVKKLEEKNE